MSKTEYDVGYKKPPKENRFKKGQSGNPNGRLKKSRNFSTLLKEELLGTITLTEQGKTRRVTKMEAMIKRVVAGALQGDKKSMGTLIDMLKRTNQIHDEQEEAETSLPDEYEQILDEYIEKEVQKRLNNKEKKGVKNES